MNLEKLCNTNLPLAKHPNGYAPLEFIYPLILMLHSGGRVLDDIKKIRLDTALSTLIKINNIPTARAFTKYLHRHATRCKDCIGFITHNALQEVPSHPVALLQHLFLPETARFLLSLQWFTVYKG